VNTLLDALRVRAAEQGNAIVFTYLHDDGITEESVTYAALYDRVRLIGNALHARGLAGERALLLYPSGLEYVCAFLGCLYAGVIAVPAYPPRKNRSIDRVLAVIADAGAVITLTTSQVRADSEKKFREAGLTSLSWTVTDEIVPAASPAPTLPDPDPGSVAFLQYTSGSTGNPKGVMVTHANLVHNTRMIGDAFGLDAHSVIVSWLPLYHDMGLIGNVLLTLFLGARAVLMSPVSFLQKPYRWLEAISRFKGTYSGAPNFAYELCVEKVSPAQKERLDLSTWAAAFNGAEPVRAATLDHFAEAFAPCGFRKAAFYPCYGMAEATLLISGGDRQQLPVVRHVAAGPLEGNQVLAVEPAGPAERVLTLVSCGHAWHGQQVHVVDPATARLCPDGTVGEIWVAGDSVARGYWNQPEKTEEIFGARITGLTAGPFLRTGDLGFVQDGELYITGRMKDLIIIRGRNHYPQDIEQTTEKAHPALRVTCCAAFSVTREGDESLVVVQEVNREAMRTLSADAVFGAIREAVANEHEVQVGAILLIRTGSIPKTSSGKIQRSACRRAFAEGTLEIVAEWHADQVRNASNAGVAADREAAPRVTPAATALQQKLTDALAGYLKLSPAAIDPDQPFDRYGLDSMGAIEVSGTVGEWLGTPVSPTLVYDYPTVRALAGYLAAPGSPQSPGQAAEAGAAEPVAVVGLACRFPGAGSADEFWQLLREGRHAVGRVPGDRWNPALGREAGLQERETALHWGGFLDGVDAFDAPFFGISPREAEQLDPQQRLLLEVSWEALERAGIAPRALAGKAVGVFVGVSSNDYARLPRPVSTLDAYYGTGNATSLAANRLSYWYDFRGPSVSVDTACSSSLVAIHQACKSLQGGESEVALAGGVNLLLHPDLSVVFARAGMLAPDGRCKTFDARADGYVRGEGCGVVVLKRLADAVRDNDDILAVIKGTAVNQDGRSNGLTAPNGPAQQAVIRQALTAAGVKPADLRYVEAHGTGTSLGDPIEVNALQHLLAEDRAAGQVCYVGSVKTNIGHLESAAGIAGLIKTILCLRHRTLVPHLHLQRINPQITLDGTRFCIPDRAVSLGDEKQRLLAGVSSFGFGGTNAHVVLEEAPRSVPAADRAPAGDAYHLLPLSAGTPGALRKLAGQYAAFLAGCPDHRLGDVAATAATGRNHLPVRLAVTGRNCPEIRTQLDRFLAEGVGETAPVARPAEGAAPVVFLFTGQGSQYAGMGETLYRQMPLFRQTFDHCSALLEDELGVSLARLLYAEKDDVRIHQTQITQPLLFAFGYSLARLWQSWDIRPAAVAGHSVGEITAACVAGVFSLEDGLRLAAGRGRLMGALPDGGEMWSVMAPAPQVEEWLAPYRDTLSVAACNGPGQTVVSGAAAPMQQLVEQLRERNVTVRRLQVSHAFHSPLMEPVLDGLAKVAGAIAMQPPHLPVFSNVTGGRIGAEIATADYWARHARATVQFMPCVQSLHREHFTTFLEIGPQPILIGLGKSMLEAAGVQWLPSLHRLQDDQATLLTSLGGLYAAGHPVDWEALYAGRAGERVSLPVYPFERKRYWLPAAQPVSAPVSLPVDGAARPVRWETAVTAAPDLLQLLLRQGGFSPEEQLLLPRVAEVLSGAFASRAALPDAGGLLHAIAYAEAALPLPAANPAGPAGTVLVFAADAAAGTLWQPALAGAGYTPVLVLAGSGYRRSSDAVYHVDPLREEDYAQLLAEVPAHHGPISRVVFAWTAPAAAPLTAEACLDHTACRHLLLLTRALCRAEGTLVPRLHVLLHQSLAVLPGELPHPAHALLTGMLKSLRLEYPQLQPVVLDFDANESPRAAARLLHEWQAAPPEMLVAYRGGKRYAGRLAAVPAPPAAAKPLAFDATGVYLVTGAGGGIGRALVPWLIARGARHLVLLSRSAGHPELTPLAQHLAGLGGSLRVLRADVADARELQRAFADLQRDGVALSGIFHLAGTRHDGLLLNLEWADFESAFRAKVAGTWNLHEASRQHPLQFFLCFSSAAALLGSPGQANYAAANAFMDALMECRRREGLPGLSLSINWGLWQGEGMARAASSHRVGGQEVVRPTDAARYLEILGRLLPGQPGDGGSVGVLDLDREAAGQYLPHLLPAGLAAVPAGAAVDPAPVAPAFHQQLAAAGPVDAYPLLAGFISRTIADVLRWEAGRLPDPTRGFAEMGLDSLMAIDLQRRLQPQLQLSFPPTVLFSYNTVHTLTGYLLGLLQAVPAASGPAAEPPVAEPAPGSDDSGSLALLTDEEAESLLLQKLANLNF
jgi:acyl transferase domain-containing protein/acyl-CoA synthetase (AMP-forming)/AMP-acid ligase II/acyl carrier protein